jgi:hypothetical protein
MPADLKSKGPEHFDAPPLFDRDRKKWQKESEDDRLDLYHPNSTAHLIVPGGTTGGIALFSLRTERSCGPWWI